MKPISSMDLYFLVKEFKILENQRIDNFYFTDETFYIKVYVSGNGNKFVTTKVSQYIYMGTSKKESLRPGGFISYLRKHLKNGYVREVLQVESERILKFLIDKKVGEEIKSYNLYIELFASGNVILCNSEDMIMQLASKKKFKDRKIVIGEKYVLPPSKELKFVDIDSELFVSKCLESDLSIVKFLAMKLGIGGKFAEEVCFRVGIDKGKLCSDIKKEDCLKIVDGVRDVLDIEISAVGYLRNSGLVDFSPFKFESIELECREFDSFNSVIASYFSLFDAKEDEHDKKIKLSDKELVKLQNRLKKQESQMMQIDVDYEKFNSMGNKIYENYALIEELLKSINSAGKEKGWDYVLEKIKNTPELSKVISKLNYKNNEIELELE